ncbi:G-protein gamma-like domain-containing protein [Pilaira anomala]|nr:G-protein gamma-like domain-containing protein [Pilaira anomala]
MPTKKSYNISEAKLKRILEYNERLREQLDLPRIPVSEASTSLITYCNSTKDPLIPSIWGPVSKEEDPFVPSAGTAGRGGGCCVVM